MDTRSAIELVELTDMAATVDDPSDAPMGAYDVSFIVVQFRHLR
jgi:hypothetical protein